MEYLDFELPIKELNEQLDKCQIIGLESNVDVSETCKQIEKKLEETKRKIYKNLTAWQRVQLSVDPGAWSLAPCRGTESAASLCSVLPGRSLSLP